MDYSQNSSIIFEIQTVESGGGAKFCRNSFIAVDDDISLDFPTFTRLIAQQVGISGSFTIKYVDEDNDQIPIESEDELREALKVAREYFNKGVFLKLIVNTTTNESHEPDLCSNDPELFDRVKVPNFPKSKMSRKKLDDKALMKGFAYRMPHGNDRNRHTSMNNAGSGHRTGNDKSRTTAKSTPALNIRSKVLQQILAGPSCSFDRETASRRGAQPPAWFISYMEKFKADILLAVEEMINCKKQQALPMKETKPKQRVKRHSEDESSDNQLGGSEPRSCKILRKLEKLQKREKKLEHKLDQRLEKMESKKKRLLIKVSQTKTVKRKSFEGSGAAPYVPYLMGGTSVRPLTPIHVNPRQIFSRTWEILNDGTIPWTDATEMRLAWGSAGLDPISRVVKCPPLAPGEQGVITVLFLSPSTPGMYHSYWHLFHMGERFGHWILCTVIVKSDEVEGAVPAINESQEVEKDLSEKLQAVTLDMNPEYISGSDLEVCSNVSESDSADSFVVVDLPMSLFSDSPAESKGTIPVKVRAKNCKVITKNEQKKNTKSSKIESQIVTEADIGSSENTKNTNTVEVTSNEAEVIPFEPIEGSVYMVDRAGNCFVTPSTQSSAVYSTVNSTCNATYPSYTQQAPVPMPQNYYSWVYPNSKVEYPAYPTSVAPTSTSQPRMKEATGCVNNNTTQLPEAKQINLMAGEPERTNPHESPVHILPETLVNGAINVASKAYNTAHSVLTNLRTKQGEASEYDPVFESNLATLFEMGFTNTTRNAEVLKSVGNDIGLAVPILLTKSRQQ